MRETQRLLLDQRRRLLDEMHASQRGIDAIDHMLYRVSNEGEHGSAGCRGSREAIG